ncbi:MAG: hypothetical protein MRJ93_11470 [Nitrososphaeraceae archaeon]|nr:hypothetical protein [Nitrososphaeraceae archaeon]
MKRVKTISHKIDLVEEKVQDLKSFSISAKKFLPNDERIEALGISIGLKDALIKMGFTLDSIVNSGPDDLAEKLRIDKYVGQIIFEEAKKLKTQF